MSAAEVRVLIIGFGNPGRLDDGLGPAFAEAVERLGLAGVDVDANYQLNVEDAERIGNYDVAIFADASLNGLEPFSCVPIEPDASRAFTTHSIAPGQVLHIAQTLFSAKTRAYVLGIRGYDFDDFGEFLSKKAKRNLEEAVAFIEMLAARAWRAEQLN